MATGLSDNLELHIGSDEMEEMEDIYCEHCENESSKTVPAVAFCADCCEYMCTVCVTYHKKLKSSHILKDGSNMPQQVCKDKCTTHKKEIIKYYCKLCQTVACPECKKTAHDTLCVFQFIPNLVKDQEDNEMREELQEITDRFLSNLNDSTMEISKNIELSSKIADEANSAIELRKEELKRDIVTEGKTIADDYDRKIEETLRQLVQEKEEKLQYFEQKKALILKHIDKSEVILKQETMEQVEQEQMKLKSLMEKAESIKVKLETQKKDITNLNVSDTGLFIAIQNTKALEKDYAEMLNEIYVQEYTFVAGNKNVNTDADIDENTFGNVVKSKTSKDKRNISPLCNFDVKWGENGEKATRINDLCLLSGFRLVAAGRYDRSLMLIDVKKKRVLSRNTMSSAPYALTNISDDHIAVTLPEEKKIQLYSVSLSNQMLISKEISTLEFKCMGMAYSEPNLYFVAGDKVMSMNVKRIGMKRAKISQFSQAVFSKPKRIVFNPRLKSFYVADGKTVVNIDCAGRLIHKSKMFWNEIRGIALDNHNTLYVSEVGALKGRVNQLSADLNHVHVLVEGSFESPYSLCYCIEENKLYCGQYDSVKVYEVD